MERFFWSGFLSPSPQLLYTLAPRVLLGSPSPTLMLTARGGQAPVTRLGSAPSHLGYSVLQISKAMVPNAHQANCGSVCACEHRDGHPHHRHTCQGVQCGDCVSTAVRTPSRTFLNVSVSIVANDEKSICPVLRSRQETKPSFYFSLKVCDTPLTSTSGTCAGCPLATAGFSLTIQCRRGLSRTIHTP